nr:hypothetical protein [Escherichia coli]
MLYFSLPEEFLKTSSVMRIISSKLKVYFIVYMGIIFFYGLFLGGGIIYGFGAIFSDGYYGVLDSIRYR